MDPRKVQELKAFVDLVKADPHVLYSPELSFFKDFLISLGADVPEPPAAAPKVESEEKEPSDSDFADPADADRMSPESDLLPSIGDLAKGLSDSEQETVNSLKGKAAEALEDGERVKALDFLNQAIAVGGATAMLLTRRADLLLKLKRPLAAIQDCDSALSLNPDSGKAFRIRGMAHRFLQNWSKAHADLASAQKIDFDDATEDVKRFVDAKWKIVDQAQREWKRSHEQPRRPSPPRNRSPPRSAPSSAPTGGMSGGFPGAGMPGMPNMGDLFSDPELMAAMSNPRVMQAMQAMMTNPGAFMQYQNDPEVGPVLMKLMGKLGGGGM